MYGKGQTGPQAAFENNAIGENSVFLAIIPYTLATAIQEQSIHTALIVATVIAGVIVAFGLLFYFMHLRRVPVYMLDAAMLVVMAVQLGVSYPYEEDIARNFDFITNATLCGLTLLSLALSYPFSLQHIRECVPRSAWRHPLVNTAATATTCAFVIAFTVNTLLYLIPVARDTWWDRNAPLTIVFKVLLPILTTFGALLLTRLWPLSIATHLMHSDGFDGIAPGRPRVMMHNPVAAV